MATGLHDVWTRTVALGINEVKPLRAPGRHIRVWELTATDIKLSIDGGQPMPIAKGWAYKADPQAKEFEGVTLYGGAAADSVQLTISHGETSDSRTQAVMSAEEVTPTVLTNSADVALVGAAAAVVVIGARADRRRAIVSNLAASAATARVGGTATAAASGTPVGPGQTLILETTAAVYAYAPAGGATLAIVEVRE